MSNNTYYKKGGFWAICDVCGFKYRASQMRERWDGLMVCPDDWNPRQPQDFVKGVPEDTTTPWSRTRVPDTFISGTCTLAGRSCIPAYAVPGCSIPGSIPEGLYESLSGWVA